MSIEEQAKQIRERVEFKFKHWSAEMVGGDVTFFVGQYDDRKRKL